MKKNNSQTIESLKEEKYNKELENNEAIKALETIKTNQKNTSEELKENKKNLDSYERLERNLIYYLHPELEEHEDGVDPLNQDEEDECEDYIREHRDNPIDSEGNTRRPVLREIEALADEASNNYNTAKATLDSLKETRKMKEIEVNYKKSELNKIEREIWEQENPGENDWWNDSDEKENFSDSDSSENFYGSDDQKAYPKSDVDDSEDNETQKSKESETQKSNEESKTQKSNSEDSTEKKESLIDDFANVSLEMPSYMDPDD